MDAPLDAVPAPLPAARHHLHLRKRDVTALLIFVVFAALVIINFRRVEVKGISMFPTYHTGQFVTVWKTVPITSLQPGDVIVFHQDKDELIKRIVFIDKSTGPQTLPPPGFPVRIVAHNGDLLTDDVAFMPYFIAVNAGLLPTPPPQNRIYVMGDNYPHSDDSRDFGPISPKQILGKVLQR